jgi:hypothetical protein
MNKIVLWSTVFITGLVSFARAGLVVILLGLPSLSLAGFVSVGNLGNAHDTTGYGAMNYEYCIGEREVTIAEWKPFYDGRTTHDVQGVLSAAYAYWNNGGSEDQQNGTNAPVTHVSLGAAAQYCNWLTTGSATHGAYTINATGGVSSVNRAFRNPQGILYVLPTENEWYKAAYYTGRGYSMYANGTATAPVQNADANYGYMDGISKIVPVGSFAPEQNGTFDMMGNVAELLEDAPGFTRGGNFNNSANGGLIKTTRRALSVGSATGFRIVRISRFKNPSVGAAVMEGWGLAMDGKDPHSFAGLSTIQGRLSNFIAGRTASAEAAGVKMELQDTDNFYELRQTGGVLEGNAFVSRRSEPKKSVNEGKAHQTLQLSLDRNQYASGLSGDNLALVVAGRGEYPLAVDGDSLVAAFSHAGTASLAVRVQESSPLNPAAAQSSEFLSSGVDLEIQASVFSDHFNTGSGNFQCLPSVFNKIQGTKIVLYPSALQQIDGNTNITTIKPLPNTLGYGKRVRFGIHISGDNVSTDETSHFNIGIINNIQEKLGVQFRIPAADLNRLAENEWYIVDEVLNSETPVYSGRPALSEALFSSFTTMQFDLDYKLTGVATNLQISLSPVLVYDDVGSLNPPLVLTNSFPAANGCDVPVYRELYLDFSSPVDLFQLKDQIALVDRNNQPVELSFSYRRNQPSGRVYLVPGEILKYDSPYFIRIANDGTIRNIAGQGYQGAVTTIPFTTVAHGGYPSGVLWTKAQVERIKILQKTEPSVADILTEYKSNADVFVAGWSPILYEYFQPSASGWTTGKIPGYSPDTKNQQSLFSTKLYQFVSDIDGTLYAGELTEANKAHYRNQWHYSFRNMLGEYAITWQMTRDIRYANALHDFILQYTNCLVRGETWFTNAYNYKPGDAYTMDSGERLAVGNFIGMDMYAQGIAGSWDMIRDSGLITPQDEVKMARVWKGMIRHVLDFQFHNLLVAHNRILHSANTIMTCFGALPPEELLEFTAAVSVNRPGVSPRMVNFDYLLNACTQVAANNVINACDSDGVSWEGPGYYHFTVAGALKIALIFMNDPHRLGLESIVNYSDPALGSSLRKHVSTMGQWGYPNGAPFSDDNASFKTTGTSFRPDFAEFLVGGAPAGDMYREMLIRQLRDYYQSTGGMRSLSTDNLPMLLPELPASTLTVEPKPLVWDVETSGVIAKTSQDPAAAMVRIDSGAFGGKSDLDALSIHYYSDGKIWVSSCGSVLYSKMSRQKTVRELPAKFFQATAMQNVVVLDGKTYSQGNGDSRYYLHGGVANTTLVAAQGERFKFYKGDSGYYRIGQLIPNLETYSRGGVLTEDYLLDQFHVKTSGSKVVKDHQMFYVTDTMQVSRTDGGTINWMQFPDFETADGNPQSAYEYHREVARTDHYSGDLQLLMQDGDHCLRVTYLDLKDVTLFWVKKAPNNELGVPGKDGWWNRLIVRSRDDDVKFTMLFEPKKTSDPEFGVRTLTSKKGGFYKVEMTGDRNLVDVIKLP